jgi:hypothetical protein
MLGGGVFAYVRGRLFDGYLTNVKRQSVSV